MQVDCLKPDFPKLLKLFIILVALFLIIFFIFLPNYTKIRELEERSIALSDKMSLLAKDTAYLETTLLKFKDDPFYIEKLARDKFGIARKNEVIVQVE